MVVPDHGEVVESDQGRPRRRSPPTSASQGVTVEIHTPHRRRRRRPLLRRRDRARRPHRRRQQAHEGRRPGPRQRSQPGRPQGPLQRPDRPDRLSRPRRAIGAHDRAAHNARYVKLGGRRPEGSGGVEEPLRRRPGGPARPAASARSRSTSSTAASRTYSRSRSSSSCVARDDQLRLAEAELVPALAGDVGAWRHAWRQNSRGRPGPVRSGSTLPHHPHRRSSADSVMTKCYRDASGAADGCVRERPTVGPATLAGLTIPCGRVPVERLLGSGRASGAEGATAPEPLRPQDHTGEATLEPQATAGDPPTDPRPGASMPDRSPATTFADRHLGPAPGGRRAHARRPRRGHARRADRPGGAEDDPHRPAAARCPTPASEPEVLATLRTLADRNQVVTSLIGTGYSGTHTPGRDPAQRARGTRPGTRPTRRTSPRSARAGSRRSSTSRRWSRTSPGWRSPTRRCSTSRPRRPRR